MPLSTTTRQGRVDEQSLTLNLYFNYKVIIIKKSIYLDTRYTRSSSSRHSKVGSTTQLYFNYRNTATANFGDQEIKKKLSPDSRCDRSCVKYIYSM